MHLGSVWGLVWIHPLSLQLPCFVILHIIWTGYKNPPLFGDPLGVSSSNYPLSPLGYAAMNLYNGFNTALLIATVACESVGAAPFLNLAYLLSFTIVTIS